MTVCLCSFTKEKSKGHSQMSHMSGFIIKSAIILFCVTAALALLDT